MHRILLREDAIFVDFHNQRLHSVVPKPYDSEAARVHRAVAMGQLIIDVLAQTGEDADQPAAKVRVGIDTGKALAVNNESEDPMTGAPRRISPRFCTEAKTTTAL